MKEFRKQLHNIKKIKTEIEEEEKRIEDGIKTKKIVKDTVRKEVLTGRVRKGVKLGKRHYRFKETIPAEERPEKVSQV